MKKFKWCLCLTGFLVILLTASSLIACSLVGETIPQNRTKEQFEFEKTFNPMFKFLEQEQKDFNGLEAYKSSVYIKNGDEVRRYEIDLDITKAEGKGDNRIQIGENKKTVPVSYSNGKLHYDSEIEPLFDEEILNLAVSRDYFASLDVEKTFKSGETELREIIYQPENHSKLYKYLKNKYDLPEDTNCRVRIKHSSGGIYRTSIQMKSMTKSIQIDLRVFEN